MIPVQAQPLTRDRATGTCSQQSFLLFATFPVALLQPWTKKHVLQLSTVTLSFRERQILL